MQENRLNNITHIPLGGVYQQLARVNRVTENVEI